MKEKEKELYKVTIDYDVNEIAYMRLDKGEKKLLYWFEEVCILISVDMYAIDEVKIVEF